MNITKQSAIKSLQTTPDNKVEAILIHQDATANDKQILLKKIVKDTERATKQKRSVTIITITD
jgi:hypothetical protein